MPNENKTKYNLFTIRVWGDEVLATDCGDEVALWLSQYIFQKDTGARLVYFPYTDKSPRVVKPKPGHPWMRETDGVIVTRFNLLARARTRCNYIYLGNLVGGVQRFDPIPLTKCRVGQ